MQILDKPDPFLEQRRIEEKFDEALKDGCPDKKEMVDHPAHYGGEDNVYEVIKVMEAWLTPEEFIGALKFNSFKYGARHRSKNGREDLKKKKWYDDYLEDYLARNPNLTV